MKKKLVSLHASFSVARGVCVDEDYGKVSTYLFHFQNGKGQISVDIMCDGVVTISPKNHDDDAYLCLEPDQLAAIAAACQELAAGRKEEV